MTDGAAINLEERIAKAIHDERPDTQIPKETK